MEPADTDENKTNSPETLGKKGRLELVRNPSLSLQVFYGLWPSPSNPRTHGEHPNLKAFDATSQQFFLLNSGCPSKTVRVLMKANEANLRERFFPSELYNWGPMHGRSSPQSAA